jgi:hypothetical protein
MERVALALVAFRISQDMSDDPPLILARDRRVTAVSEWKFDLLFGPDVPPEMRVDQPVREEGGAEMRGRNS